MNMQDVVITGVGVRTPMGQSCREVREAFAAGNPLTRRLAEHGAEARTGAMLGEIAASVGLSAWDTLQTEPLARMVLPAASAAWADAGMETALFSSHRVGVYLGTGTGVPNNTHAHQIGIQLGLKGACETFMAGCGSSASALGEAFRAIRHGYLDAAVAGGVDAPLSGSAYRVWEAAGFLAPTGDDPVCRPFGSRRNGTLLGEGAVLFLLESAAHARARGARIHARLAGYGTATTHGLGQPESGGRALCVEKCLQDARLGPDQVGYISADACGDRLSDALEVSALRRVFGARLSQVPMSATKSIHGHMVGASGAAGLLPALLALDDGLIAPTATLDEVDPDFADLSLSAHCTQARLPVHVALVNSFAPGGSNACMALTRH